MNNTAHVCYSPFSSFSDHAPETKRLAHVTSYHFYRAMHFSAKARYCDRMSSVSPSVRPSVTLVNCDHIGWNSSKIISSLVSLGCSLFATPT